MPKPLVSDELWELIEPLIPVKPRRFVHPGRKPLPDRQVLTGILFVLRTGIPWEHLPQEMGCGSGMTCWRRLRDWQQAGVWQALHELLLAKLNGAEEIDWSRAVVDASYVRAVWGLQNLPKPGGSAQSRLEAPPDHRRPRRPTWLPSNRRQLQRRHPTIAAARGDPARTRQARPTASPTARAARRPRLRLQPAPPQAARAPDHTDHRQTRDRARLRARQTTLGSRAHDLLASPAPPPSRPLRTRADIHEAFLSIACSLICLKQLERSAFC